MGKTERLKTRLLRSAVEENVETIRGLAPKSLRRVNRLVNALLSRRLRMALSLVVFLSGSHLVARFAWSSAASAAVTPGTSAAVTGLRLPGVASFSKPRPIDPAVLALGVRHVVIDAGHGGSNSGTAAAGGLKEKDLTIDIADRLRRLLVEHDVAVIMTREGDETVSLQQRAETANRGHGDIFVSIHLNSLTPRSARGVETYYLGSTDDPSLGEVAADENRDSGYSLSDMRTLLNRIYLDARKDESRRLAESIQQAVFRSLRRVNPALENRGVKTAPFLVLVATEMPAILAEVSCLSNDEEAKRLSRPEYRQVIAEALFGGVRAYAGERVSRFHKDTESGS